MVLHLIKMIVTDLDETLFHTDKTISLFTKETLAKVRNKGIKTVFATARGNSTKKLVPYELFDAYILTNGASAFIDGVFVYKKTIPPEVARLILQKLTEFGMDAAAEINGIHHANFDVQKRWDYIPNYILSDFSRFDGNSDKLYAMVEKPEQVGMIAAVLPELIYLNVSKDNMAMMMHRDATKMKAINAVAQKWGVDASEIISFGDDINDIEMLTKCGVGVAMGNALDEVIEISDFVCDTNDNDGVAKWILERIL